MTFKSAGAWSLLVLVIAVAFCFTLKPLIHKEPIQEVTDSELVYMGDDAEGDSWYFVMKAEVKDWVAILTPLLSVVVGAVGFLFGKRRKDGTHKSTPI